MITWPRGVNGLCFGGDYNPEQWPEQVWAEDIALMRTAGVNLVSLGVFAWSWLEPEEGRYDFDWLDRVLDRLFAGGVRAALATPTASPPPWFGLAHPEALPLTAAGGRLWHGSRDTYCVSAPAYREAAVRIADVLAQRYADHPALAMWHVHNEYGTWCYCDFVAESFRTWLHGRYGDLATLNDAWTTAFWSQRYADWAHVLPPRATQYLQNPAQVLDFRRFLSDEHLANFRAQRDALRLRTPDVPITTNLALASWVPVNPRIWAAHTDLVAIDHYPGSLATAAHETAFTADLARSWAGGGSWLLMEQAMAAVNEGGRTVMKPPGAMARHSLSHVARGSRGAMSFQWRQSRGGAEMYHPGMVPHAGADSRVFREVCDVGAVLGRLGEVHAGRIDADAAILWDTECWWALAVDGLPARSIEYGDEVRAAHRTLWSAGVPVDFAHPADDLRRYRLVVVPALYLLSDEAAAALTGYVEGGGHLVLSYLSGIADPSHRVRVGGYPGAFRDLLGVRVEEFHPLADGDTVALSDGGTGRVWSEYLHAEAEVEVLVRYADPGLLAGGGPAGSLAGVGRPADGGGGGPAGLLAGRPAVTRRRYGSGAAWYVSTRLDDAAYARLLLNALGAANTGAHPTVGVEVIRRHGTDTSWCFILNHTDGEQWVAVQGLDLVSGTRVDGQMVVPAGGFAVVREDVPDLVGLRSDADPRRSHA